MVQHPFSFPHKFRAVRPCMDSILIDIDKIHHFTVDQEAYMKNVPLQRSGPPNGIKERKRFPNQDQAALKPMIRGTAME